MGCCPKSIFTASSADEINTMPQGEIPPVYISRDNSSSSSGIQSGRGRLNKTSKRPQLAGVKLQTSASLHPLEIAASELEDAYSKLDLDKLLQDSFQAEYLLRYCASERSSENIVFMQSMRKLYCERATESTLSWRLVEEIFATHFAEGCIAPLNVAGNLVLQITAWHEAKSRGESCDPPFGALDECYHACHTLVLFGVFPRFKASPLCAEMLALRLQRLLPRADFGHLLQLSLTGLQRAVVHCWLDLRAYTAQYSTCDAAASDVSCVQRGLLLFDAHKASLRRCWRVGSLEHQALLLVEGGLDHASPKLFQPLLSPLLELLQPAYAAFLDSPAGCKYLRDCGLKRLPQLPPETAQGGSGKSAGEDYLADW